MASHDAYLRGALGKYKDPDKTRNDVIGTLENYIDLRPKLDQFVFNDGQSKELLSLSGTIPVSYRGNTYNIPICIWLMDTHPYNPPMVYVIPTSSMQIKTGKHVDSNGRIYLPYLHEWAHNKMDLLGLLGVMQVLFGEDPPVFSRVSQSGQAASNSSYSVGGMQMQSHAHHYPAYSHSVSTAGGTINPETIRASLHSAIQDKMKRRLTELMQQHQAELEALTRTQHDLDKGRTKLDEMIQKMEQDQVKIDHCMNVLNERSNEVQSTLNKINNQQQVDIDDVIVASTPVYKQLVTAFAEEQSTEDIIYYLSKGLKNQVIDLEVYLKKVREISRRQFMLRAVIQKCREKAGLSELN